MLLDDMTLDAILLGNIRQITDRWTRHRVLYVYVSVYFYAQKAITLQ